MKFEILIPCGNPTALVWDENFSKTDKYEINKNLMNKFNFIEQVGFLNKIDGGIKLEMAGGETCLNAIRSAAFLEMSDNTNSCIVNSCGEDYQCGKFQNLIYISNKLNSINFKFLKDNQILVNLKEISHIVSFEKFSFKDDDEFKKFAFLELQKHGLTKFKACGFIICDDDLIFPAVYVRDVDTLFFESACGSGSLAVGIAKNLTKGINYCKLIQPSQKTIFVEIFKQNDNFDKFKLYGEVKIYDRKNF
ncbi:hypothetical protein F1B92_00980 [Campylobacter sp. FMV-PI01]|uniref:Diaminopimelate epimerase n=1 Tax=Campylobacter portucalensis TaxID=2608384 RepID=A0A6L5WJ76_9BACT|nr:hypothetical protein [Campylobacter portucalensis]MSN95781.1 hypothetical protein [Campylobacter portucalensis]